LDASDNNAKAEFNNALNVAEKRAILVCLHKLGVPIEMPVGNTFDIKNIQFLSNPIDKDEITDMKTQIDKGHCDHLFYRDVDRYFTENTRIKTIRDIGKRIATEYLSKAYLSKTKCNECDKESVGLTPPSDWTDKFSWGELQRVLVFQSKVKYFGYFNDNDGKPNTAKIDQLIREIDAGLWDEYLQWDYSAYQNMLAQKQVAETSLNMINAIQPNNVQNYEQTQRSDENHANTSN